MNAGHVAPYLHWVLNDFTNLFCVAYAMTAPSAEALAEWAITEAIDELTEFAANGFFEVVDDAAARNERHVIRLAKRLDAAYRRGIEAAAQVVRARACGYQALPGSIFSSQLVAEDLSRLEQRIRAVVPPPEDKAT